MEKLYLIRYGEIGLKGENRSLFEDKLLSNINKKIKIFDKNLKIYKKPGRIYLITETTKNIVINKLKKTPGIVSFSPVQKVKLDYDLIKKEVLNSAKSFKNKGKINFRISARRSNKKYKYDSMQLQKLLGEYVIDNLTGVDLNVDLYKPDLDINVEIRKDFAYIYTEIIEGLGGLPVGISGTVGLMLSGGIDSPVAGYMSLKRGVKIIPIYFHSFPFTTDRAKEKVIDITKTLSNYQHNIKLHVVDFTKILTEINKNCPDKLLTIIMRRLMIKITEMLISKYDGKAIITGESIGQVASQTLEAIQVTNNISALPILRPLIGLNKVQIVNLAKKIDTYDISIQPYDDCCTVFVPKNPETKPTLEQIIQGEKKLNIDKLIKQAVKSVQILNITDEKLVD
ncbi:MAG: tRNA 4-thiouridine(8) synthase ThiI [Halanaerobiales bacterium]|nr:tRNA 4-thiouridine(8) synthase ThiI [Halanaerobiales bacterium]